MNSTANTINSLYTSIIKKKISYERKRKSFKNVIWKYDEQITNNNFFLINHKLSHTEQKTQPNCSKVGIVLVIVVVIVVIVIISLLCVRMYVKLMDVYARTVNRERKGEY